MPKTRTLICLSVTTRAWTALSYKKGGVVVKTPCIEYRHSVTELGKRGPTFTFRTQAPLPLKQGDVFRARTCEWDKRDMWAYPTYEITGEIEQNV